MREKKNHFDTCVLDIEDKANWGSAQERRFVISFETKR